MTDMTKFDEIQKQLLMEVADLHKVPEGAYNIRSDSKSVARASTANIENNVQGRCERNGHMHKTRHKKTKVCISPLS